MKLTDEQNKAVTDITIKFINSVMSKLESYHRNKVQNNQISELTDNLVDWRNQQGLTIYINYELKDSQYQYGKIDMICSNNPTKLKDVLGVASSTQTYHALTNTEIGKNIIALSPDKNQWLSKQMSILQKLIRGYVPNAPESFFLYVSEKGVVELR